MSNKTSVIITIVLLTVFVGVKLGAYFTYKSAFSDQERWSKICVRGQLIYAIVLTDHSTAVNALNEDGTPVKCQVKST